MQAIFHKYRLQLLMFGPGQSLDRRLDFHLHAQLGAVGDYELTFGSVLQMLRPETIFKMTDRFLCSYIFLLPETEQPSYPVIAPYLAVEPTMEQLLENAEKSGVRAQQFRLREDPFREIPVLRDERMIFAPLESFCEKLWGRQDYAVVDINQELTELAAFFPAAEQGGVHPIFLDSISSDFARQIESVASVEAVQALMEEMFRSYCRLVKKHSTKNYSQPVQKAIIQIESDLAGELSLKVLADAQNINASYLSALFKKETGQTITDYVNQKHVRAAARLLSTSKLQIQTIAQHCGISDVNYFSKIFKKYMGQTPKEFRQKTQTRALP